MKFLSKQQCWKIKCGGYYPQDFFMVMVAAVLFFLFCVAVSLLLFVVWFSSVSLSEVPPPAGKGMNHKWGRGAVSAPKKSKSKNRALSAGEYAPI